MQTIHTAVLLAMLLALPVAAQERPVRLDTLRAGAASRLVAGAASIARSVDVLDRAALESLPARNAADVLARALGVDLQARSAAQADVGVRGSSFEQVLVLIDGVPVNDDQTGHFHLDVAVPLDAIERVEVLRGPASAVYGGSAVGGVINIVTRRSADQAVRVEGGSFGGLAAGIEAGALRGGVTARVSAEHDRSDGHRPGTDHRITQGRLALTAPVAGGSLRSDVALARRDFGADAFYASFDSYEETRAVTAAVSWRSAPAAWTVEPRVSFRRHEDDFILVRGNPALYRNVHSTEQLGGELVARWSGEEMRLAFGVDGTHSTLESTNLGDRTESRGAVFAELAAGDAVRTLLTLGVRLDGHTTFGSHLSPSIAAGHRLSERVRVRASAGGGFRAPTWTERYYEDPGNIGNPDLTVERFWTGELGGELTLSSLAALDVAVFARRAEDLIDWARPSGAGPEAPYHTLNVERATFRGLETSLKAGLGAAQLTARAALLGLSAEEARGMSSKYALRPLEQTASLELVVPLGAAVRAALRGAHFARAAADPDAGTDDWQLVDARLSGRWRGVQLFAQVTNLTDTRYMDVSVRPAPGRAFGVGMRVQR